MLDLFFLLKKKCAIFSAQTFFLPEKKWFNKTNTPSPLPQKCANIMHPIQPQTPQMVIKLPIGDFELEIVVLRIRDWGFKSPIHNHKNINP